MGKLWKRLFSTTKTMISWEYNWNIMVVQSNFSGEIVDII
jgi:hypothetical protein